MHWKKYTCGLGCLLLLSGFLTMAGCGGGEGDVVRPGKKNVKEGKGGKEKPPPETEVVVPKAYGIIVGTVTLEGAMPAMPKQEFSGVNAAACAAGAAEKEKLQQLWLVNESNKGVENAVVFLKMPDGTYYKPKAEDLKRTDVVELRQPHCAFIPHVVALYPSYYDGETKDLKPSGQVFKIFNDAPFNHNTGIIPNDDALNSKTGFTLNAGESKAVTLTPDPGGPLGLKCDIHGWMTGKAWVFDHPWAAVTDKDGKFEIKNVPVGVKLYVVGWHEGGGYFHGGQSGTEATLKEKTELNLKLKAK